ncbi:hypothetical protein AX15_005165 [Amanita polypyramis BW_CC]|nr:hypothetical protein AX15_005165 [Amanita polypyramis BW_CC]
MQLSLFAFLLATSVYVVNGQVNECNCAGRYYDNTYLSNSIDTANAGGAGNYPHRYNNREGILFPDCAGPFNEYPILASGAAYSGGRPGPDRVIYETSGDLCGCITHTGAPRSNGFVPCNF